MAIDEQTKPQGSWLLLKRLVVEHVRPYLGRLALA